MTPTARPDERCEFDDVAELMFVEVFLHCGDQSDGQAHFRAVVQRLLFDCAQVASADFTMCSFVESVELQINVDRPDRMCCAVRAQQRTGYRRPAEYRSC